MSNRKLLLKARKQAGIKSGVETLREDIRLFRYAIPVDFLNMNEQDFWRHFNKLYQTNYILTCLYIDKLSRTHDLKDYQAKIIRGYFPDFQVHCG